jgi:hypothetical protein
MPGSHRAHVYLLLYLLYSHDVPVPGSRGASLGQYADDMAYWCAHRSAAGAFRALQLLLDALQRWMSRWRVLPNAVKTQLMLFRHRHKTQKLTQMPFRRSILLWGARVYVSAAAKYLGVTFSPTLDWQLLTRDVCLRARRRMNLLVMLRGRIRGCSFQTLRHTYRVFLRPLFEHAAGALFPVLSRHLYRYLSLERRILRRIARLHPWTRNEEVYEIAEVEPLSGRLDNLCMSYVDRLMDRGRTTLMDQLYSPRDELGSLRFQYPLIADFLPTYG